MLAEQTGRDRRQHKRVPVELWVIETHNSATYHHRISNLSVGGLYIRDTISRAAGTRVDLSLLVPRHEPLSLRGEVVPPRPGVEGMHIRFVELDDEIRQRIYDIVNRLLPDDEYTNPGIIGA